MKLIKPFSEILKQDKISDTNKLNLQIIFVTKKKQK